ncbi:type IV toxin-antitoxin system AbiEi family antitoxin domain-containing protein [Kribbella sp. NPDC051952]|uniref:type IV toxin-antitoxin system AbiEi family antitoxin domain-containing protein n=1 Tax=Kribbella sp. NPDC051952 TaxID=3154851 RepID=UPI0034321975
MNPKLKLLAEAQGGVFSRRQALASGYTPRQIVERLGDGRWERLRRGQYAERLDLAALPPWEQQRISHLRIVHAVMNSLRAGTVVISHQSALALHGLPLWGLDLTRVHVTRVDDRAGGLVAGVQHHLGELVPADLTHAAGLPVTTVPRALVETACTTSFEAAVVTADVVLREGLVDADELHRLLMVTEFWPGSPTARAALGFANPLSESVGESRLRVLMHRFGLPEPVLQAEFADSDGFVARVDFHFPSYRTVVEFDGMLKYGDGSPEVLVHEKRREDRLRALGLQLVRATWADFNRPAHLAATIRQACWVSGLGVGGGLRPGGLRSGVLGGPSRGRRSRRGPC